MFMSLNISLWSLWCSAPLRKLLPCIVSLVYIICLVKISSGIHSERLTAKDIYIVSPWEFLQNSQNSAISLKTNHSENKHFMPDSETVEGFNMVWIRDLACIHFLHLALLIRNCHGIPTGPHKRNLLNQWVVARHGLECLGKRKAKTSSRYH